MSRRCASCGVLWAGDAIVKLRRNIEAHGGDVGLVTVTAPGRAVLPFDEGGEQVQRAVARRFNRQVRHEWTKAHRKASQAAKRLLARMIEDGLAPEGARWAIVARAWAFQRRGVLHVHVVVPMGSGWDRMCSQLYADVLDELRGKHGFGFVDRGTRTKLGSVWRGRRMLQVIPAGRAAGYLAKYVAGVKRGGVLELSVTVAHPDVPGHVLHVDRHLTTATGCTMRSLRLRRRAHVLCEHAIGRGLDPYGLVGDEATDEHMIAVLGPMLEDPL